MMMNTTTQRGKVWHLVPHSKIGPNSTPLGYSEILWESMVKKMRSRFNGFRATG